MSSKLDLKQRPRRNRRNDSIRDLVAENRLEIRRFIYPIFLQSGQKKKDEILSMPGQYRWSLDGILNLVEKSMGLGLKHFALFPVIEDGLKNSAASEALNDKGLLPKAVREIKKQFPEAVLYTDVALDPYSSDGHDGLVKDGQILNDETVKVLVEMALVQADAGADFVSPSDMMDGRIGAIRKGLDLGGFTNTGILAYSAKYASAFYGPFRDALDSAPRFGDKKTYQMDPRNRKEALREIALDIREGADIVMVKPALSYLDVIRDVKAASSVPVAAYNVSGEYALVKMAGEKKLMDYKKLRDETLISIFRAGADIILSYFALELAEDLKKT